MADTSVKFFHWQMTGAPTLTGAAGGLIPVLDACLKDGFGLKSVDSLVVASGVATVTISSGHSALRDGVQLLAGITGTYAGLNGEQKVTLVSGSTYKFACPGQPDGTAAGTITTKVAALGYTKPYSGTNKAAYKSGDVTSLGMYLRVDDTVTKNAIVKGYESMTDIDTGSGAFFGATNSFWPKSSTADATARPWFIVGDTRSFYFWSEPNTSTVSGVTSQALLTFDGDIIPRRSNDAYAHTLVTNEADWTAVTSTVIYDAAGLAIDAREAFKCPRAPHGLGGQQMQGFYAASRKFGSNTSSRSGKGSQFFPNAADSGVDFDEAVLTDLDTASIRGRMPGSYVMPQNVDFAFQTFDLLDGAGDLAGKRLMFMRVGSPGYNTQNTSNGQVGVVAFDITGPWR
jgi:hypothetical protein